MIIKVALLAEGVDRNTASSRACVSSCHVALLAEGVDRNLMSVAHPFRLLVALLAEGVDRNKLKITVAVSRICRPPRGGRG